MLIGMIAPAPSPWIALAAIRVNMPVAAPHITEPTRNTATPSKYRRRRPYKSESRPQIGTEAVDVSR